MSAAILPFPARQDHPQANAYGFPPVAALPVDQDGTRVLINGRLFHAFMGETGATRVAEALGVLAEYGLLGRVR